MCMKKILFSTAILTFLKTNYSIYRAMGVFSVFWFIFSFQNLIGAWWMLLHPYSSNQHSCISHELVPRFCIQQICSHWKPVFIFDWVMDHGWIFFLFQELSYYSRLHFSWGTPFQLKSQIYRTKWSEEGQFMRFAQALSRKCAPVLLYRANFTSQRQPPLSGKPSFVLVRPEFWILLYYYLKLGFEVE